MIFFCKNRETFSFLFFNVYNMFTIEIEDGREAPQKPSICINKEYQSTKENWKIKD